MEKIKEYAKILRKNQTPQERIMWNLIRKRQLYGMKFLRQYVIEPYIVDFVCRERKIIIEIDGGQHNCPDSINYDKERTKFLQNLDYKVIRFWNNDIDGNLDGVYQELLKFCK